ncbi:hypothetical protein [Microbacterium sp. SLBN-111]|uniref:hypothetical protein n=1 Tax=Microbacterium sp. SLBN-111 TaxID=3377733 RepID=UPI003C7558B3
MTETQSTAETMDPKFAARMIEMRRTLLAAPLTAMYAAARIAIQVRTDSDVVLNHLDAANRTHFGDTPEAQRGRTGVLLGMRIQNWLYTRGVERRTAERRRADLRLRAESAQTLLGEDDSHVRAYWESYYLELARESATRDEAIAAYRLSLARRGWRNVRDPLNFRLSLATQNLATMLRRSDDPGDWAEGERITAVNAEWRQATFGARHPFTLVAEGNRVLNVLYRLEETADDGEFGPVDRRAARKVMRDATELYRNRKDVLGVHHGGTVKAMSYQARALRLLDNAQEARALAERALAHYLTYSSKNDTTLTAVLRVIAAEGYAAEAEEAQRNVREASERGAMTAVKTEIARAAKVWQTVDAMLDLAEADLVRWASRAVWLARLQKVRVRRGASTVG